MTKKNLIDHYLYLRAVEVIFNISDDTIDGMLTSVLGDFQKNLSVVEMTNVLYKISEYRFQIKKYSAFAGELLEKYVIPKMAKEDVEESEKKVGDFVKKISERDDFVDFLKGAFQAIMTDYGVKLVKRLNGDLARPGENK